MKKERKNLYPKNKEFFIKLMNFYKEVLSLLEAEKIKPVLWGSLAYFIFVEDKNVIINDIDLIVGEKYFDKITNLLRKNRIKYKHSKKWHCIEAYKDKLKIDFDSAEHWCKNISIKSKLINFNGFKIRVLDLDELTIIYQGAYKNNKDRKRKGFYKVKYKRLKSLKS